MRNVLDGLWVEKYRPDKLQDVVLSDDLRDKLTSFVESRQIPHLLFHGHPGCGKTTVARILVRELGAEVVELNASDERGIETIRELKKFALVASIQDWKIIFLDEADQLTGPAQYTLRNMLEKFAPSCRFIMTANYPERIIRELISRLQVLSFSGLPMKQMYKMLVRVLVSEDIEYDDEDLFKIIEDAEGDMRRAIGLAQSLVKGDKLQYESPRDRITAEDLLSYAQQGKWASIRTTLEDGVDFCHIYSKLFDVVFERAPDAAVRIVGEYGYRDSLVWDKNVNLLCCLHELSQAVY